MVALAGLAGSLYLSLGMNLKACPLCFYQRSFVMSLVALLAVGLLTSAGRGVRLSLFGLPIVTAGLGVALFHVSLEMGEKLECPKGALGYGTAPQQSLACFVVLFALLLVDALRQPDRRSMVVGLVLGGLLAVGSCTSNPPIPPTPSQPYPGPPEICRPPVKADA